MSKRKVIANYDVYSDVFTANRIVTMGRTYKVLIEKEYCYLISCDDTIDRWVSRGKFIDIKPEGAPKIYIGGSLANPMIVQVTKELQDAGIYAFSEWYTPGPEADVLWRDYERTLGYSYKEALKRPAAVNTFNFDKRNIDECNVFLMVLPCGKSAHMELGYAIGKGKRGFILMPEEPERWDVMYGFAEAVISTTKELVDAIKSS